MYVNLIGYDLELNAYGKNKVRHYWHPSPNKIILFQ